MLCRRLPLFKMSVVVMALITVKEVIFLLDSKYAIPKIRASNASKDTEAPPSNSDSDARRYSSTVKDELMVAPLNSFYPTKAQDELSAITTRVTFPTHGELAKRFSQRYEHLRAKCAEFQGDIPARMKLWLYEAMYYSRKYRLLGCLIAKAGVTTWKVHLNRMLGYNGMSRNTDHIKAFKMMPLSKLKKMMTADDVTRVINVRNPIDRLVSGYKDKFHNGQPQMTETSNSFYEKAFRILGRSRRHGAEATITFQEFIQYVLGESKRGLSAMNCHWRPIYSICQPCTSDYKYILKLDTIEEDFFFLKEELGIGEMNVTLKMNANQKQSRSGDDYFRGLPAYLLAGIKDLYKYDFILFGYVMPDYLENVS